MKKKIISMLLVVAMVLSFAPAFDLTAFAENPEWDISATGADNVTATLIQNEGSPVTYTLALTGTGATFNYYPDFDIYPAWVDWGYADSITDVTVADGITYLGMHLFYGLNYGKTVTVNGDLNTIAGNAFRDFGKNNNDQITMTFKGNIGEIGNNAFAHIGENTKTTEITFEGEVGSIGKAAFEYVGAAGVWTVDTEDPEVSYLTDMIDDSSTTLIFKENVGNISEKAFYSVGCGAEQFSIDFEKNLGDISYDAFANAGSHNIMQQYSDLGYMIKPISPIGSASFTVGGTTGDILGNAFNQFGYNAETTTMEFADDVGNIGYRAFYYVGISSKDTSIAFGGDIGVIDQESFYCVGSAAGIVEREDIFEFIDTYGIDNAPDTDYFEAVDGLDDSSATLTVEGDITEIYNAAFACFGKYADDVTMTFNGNVGTIYNAAFSNVGSQEFSKFDLAYYSEWGYCEYIDYAYENFDATVNIKFNGTVGNICEYAFGEVGKYAKITTIDFAKDVGDIDSEAFYNVGTAAILCYNDDKTMNEPTAGIGNSELSITFGGDAGEIGSYAFAYAGEYANKVTIRFAGDILGDIGDCAFYKINDYDIYEYIGENPSFDYNYGFISAKPDADRDTELVISFGGDIQGEIGDGAFEYAGYAAKEATISFAGDVGGDIGEYAFYEVGNNIYTIDDSFTKITFGGVVDGDIGEYAFGCAGYESDTTTITFGGDVGDLGYCGFYYAGYNSDNLTITFGGDVGDLDNYCFSYVGRNVIWEQNKDIDDWGIVGSNAGSEVSIIFNGNAGDIGVSCFEYVGQGADSTTIWFKKNVGDIGAGAFYQTGDHYTTKFDETEQAFVEIEPELNRPITVSIKIDGNAGELGRQAFAYTGTNATDIDIAFSSYSKDIPYYAFFELGKNCDDINLDISMPNVTEVGYAAFYNAGKLTFKNGFNNLFKNVKTFAAWSFGNAGLTDEQFETLHELASSEDGTIIVGADAFSRDEDGGVYTDYPNVSENWTTIPVNMVKKANIIDDPTKYSTEVTATMTKLLDGSDITEVGLYAAEVVELGIVNTSEYDDEDLFIRLSATGEGAKSLMPFISPDMIRSHEWESFYDGNEHFSQDLNWFAISQWYADYGDDYEHGFGMPESITAEVYVRTFNEDDEPVFTKLTETTFLNLGGEIQDANLFGTLDGAKLATFTDETASLAELYAALGVPHVADCLEAFNIQSDNESILVIDDNDNFTYYGTGETNIRFHAYIESCTFFNDAYTFDPNDYPKEEDYVYAKLYILDKPEVEVTTSTITLTGNTVDEGWEYSIDGITWNAVTETIQFNGLNDYTKYTITYRKNTVTSGDPDYVYAKLYATTERASGCSHYETVFLKEGELNLYLGKSSCGNFEFKKTASGWSIKNTTTGKYLAFDAKKNCYTESETEYSWNYDGGFYANVKSVVTTGALFWTRTRVVTTKYYLTATLNGLAACPVKTLAIVQELVTNTEHKFVYENCGDTHTCTCVYCGAVFTECNHEYDETTHLCDCGKPDPEACYVSGVKVSEKPIFTTTGFWIWRRTSYTYQYSIAPITQNIKVAKVEYSSDGAKWITGKSFSSSLKLNKIFVRVTDSDGKVTKWVWDGKTVTPYGTK